VRSHPRITAAAAFVAAVLTLATAASGVAGTPARAPRKPLALHVNWRLVARQVYGVLRAERYVWLSESLSNLTGILIDERTGRRLAVSLPAGCARLGPELLSTT
jgi:hypothetical protein